MENPDDGTESITWKIQMILLKRKANENKQNQANESSATKHGGKKN
jgi:hypothetical protein